MARTVARTDPQKQLSDAERVWRDVRRNAAAKPEQVRDAAVDYVIAARLAGRYKEASHAAREAIDVLCAVRTESGQYAPAMAALVEAHACLSSLDAGDPDAAERWLEAARGRFVAAPPRAGSGPVRAPALRPDAETASALCRAEGNVHLARRRWLEGAEAFTRGLATTTDPLERTIAMYNVGEAYVRLERWADAEKMFHDARPEKEAAGDTWGLAFVYWGIGQCRHKLASSIPAAAQSTTHGAQGTEHGAQGTSKTSSSTSSSSKAMLDEALGWADKAAAMSKQLADPKIGARIHALRARVLVTIGRLDAADDAARDAVREATRAALPRERAEAQLTLASVLLARGYGRRAQQAAEQAIEVAAAGGVVELEREARAVLEEARTSITG